jgi:hypothetical protein
MKKGRHPSDAAPNARFPHHASPCQVNVPPHVPSEPLVKRGLTEARPFLPETKERRGPPGANEPWGWEESSPPLPARVAALRDRSQAEPPGGFRWPKLLKTSQRTHAAPADGPSD